ncbi:MAG: putative toxin-antitoxin system toxin component, PIN family [Phycisphaerae bacterium]
MTTTVPSVVYDCNIFVQALINPVGPAGRCIEQVRVATVRLFITNFILNEIRESHLKIPAKYGVTPEQTSRLADAVLAAATLLSNVPPAFVYTRDPDDAHYVNAALAANAHLIVSRDRDLLDLMGTSTDALDFRTRFPDLRILDPVQFLREIDGSTPTAGTRP